MSNISVVMPCYKVKKHVLNVVSQIGYEVSNIYCIDDACPEDSGSFIAQNIKDKRVKVLYHEKNQGVGGAVITGYKNAIEDGAEIIVKMDGDGQMDPAYVERLIGPIRDDSADYTKGNRFNEYGALQKMPKLRLFGNSILSFMVKSASGYWNLMDPTNGYTAIHRRVLEKLNLEKISKRYFFETDMLINLNIINAVINDVAIPCKYEGQKSSLSIAKCFVDFPPKVLRGFLKRIFLKYFIHDFNMLSVYVIFGIPLLGFGVIKGIVEWIESIQTGIPRTTGTIMLVVLPIIIGFQMLLQAISIDIASIPNKAHGKGNRS